MVGWEAKTSRTIGQVLTCMGANIYIAEFMPVVFLTSVIILVPWLKNLRLEIDRRIHTITTLLSVFGTGDDKVLLKL